MTGHPDQAIGDVTLGATLGELVARHPQRAQLFERLRFDCCCGGTTTLREACRERGLDPHAIRELILAEDAAAPVVESELERRDWGQASLNREVGETLAKLRELTHDHDASGALCRTHRRLLAALEALELDLHQHIHEENNVLLPRLRAARDGHGSMDPLPACCRGWLAEQAHLNAHRARTSIRPHHGP